MKKIIICALCATLLFIFCACSEKPSTKSSGSTRYEAMSEYIGNPTRYEGVGVTINAECTVVYNFSKNEIARRTVVVYDDDSNMRALYEIRKADGKYPQSGTVATVVGKFTNGYIDVSEFKNVTYDTRTFDVEAIDKSADELQQFITDYRAYCNTSEYYQKSIRIYGKITIHDGYSYLTGLDENGAYTWHIELKAKDNSVKLPTSNSEYANAYEICGTLEMYMDSNLAYACINVSDILPVESVLKVEEENFSPIIDPLS